MTRAALRSRFVRFSVPLGLLFVILFFGTSRGGRPSWIDPAAVEAGRRMFPGKDVVVLLRQRSVEVESSGRRKVRDRLVYDIRRPGPGGTQVEQTYSDSFRRVKRFRGMRVTPEGVVRSFDEGASSQTATGAAVSGTWLHGLAVEGLNPGDLAAFEIESVEDFPGLRSDRFAPSRDVPCVRMEYRLKLPEGWREEVVLADPSRGDSSLSPQATAGGESVWAVDSIAARDDRDSFLAEMPEGLLILYEDPSGARSGMSTWQGVSRWFQELSRSALRDTASLGGIAAPLLAGADSTRFTETLYRAVRDRVRYEQVYLGDGGYRPHAAAEVWSKSWGDCKDKAHLLIGLLRAAGVDAHPVLVAAGCREHAPLATPFAFNHVIVAVPRHDAPGGCLYFDPTANTVPAGRLPRMDEGASALVIGSGGDSALIHLPRSRAEENLSLYKGIFLLTEEMEFEGKVQEKYTGQSAFALRARLQRFSAEEQFKWMEERVAADAPRSGIRSLVISGLETDSDTLVVSYDLLVPGAATLVGDRALIRMDPLSGRREPWFPKESCSHPLDLGSPSLLRTEISLMLPERAAVASLPADRDFANSVGSYRRRVILEGERVTWFREREVREPWIVPANYGEARAWDREVVAGDGERLVLRRG